MKKYKRRKEIHHHTPKGHGQIFQYSKTGLPVI